MYQNIINIEPVLELINEPRARGITSFDFKPIGKGIRWTSSGQLIQCLDDENVDMLSDSLFSYEINHRRYGT
ncbi:MAG: hypothetical protein HN379_11160 [Desulfobacteraceae bacterium]|jgi:hypothetical protein|nr:hypothetical protein [Desulfobacteraceae bacterium]